MGCGSSSQVQTSRAWKKERAAEAKALGRHLDTVTASSDPIRIEQLVELCQVPEVRKVLARIRGAAMDAKVTAGLLMRRYDANRNQTLEGAELSAMKEELMELAKAPFLVFLNEKFAHPNDTINGIVLLDTDKPVKASTISARLLCKVTAHFSKPETHRRTVTDSDGNSREETYTVMVPKDASQTMIQLDLPLYSTTDGMLPAGLHRWPFSFGLPADAVDTFDVSGIGFCPQGNGERSPGGLKLTYVVKAFTREAAGVAGPAGAVKGDRVALEAAMHVTAPQSTYYFVNNVALPPQLQTSAKDQDVATPPCCCSRPCNGTSSLPVLMYEAEVLMPHTQPTVVPALGAQFGTLRKGHKLQATVSMRHVGGTKAVTKWFSQLSVSCHLNLIALGCTWGGYAHVVMTRMQGEALESGGEVKQALELLYNPSAALALKAVGLSCAVGSSVPKVQLSVSAVSPVGCGSGFMKLRETATPVLELPVLVFNHALAGEGGAGANGKAGVGEGKVEEEQKTTAPVASTTSAAAADSVDVGNTEWWNQTTANPASPYTTDPYPGDEPVEAGAAATTAAVPYEMFTYKAPEKVEAHVAYKPQADAPEVVL